MALQDPFHEGERAVQARAGETHTAILNARMITPDIMSAAIPFIARQPWVILGGADAAGALWCSALVGGEGFVTATASGTELILDLTRAPSHPANPILARFPEGRRTGALFIELATRRRLRVNGRVNSSTPTQLRIAVEESFPNCPKYIQKRTFNGVPGGLSTLREATTDGPLGALEQADIAASDTLFMATGHATRGIDVSHRGGRPGFVEVLNDRTLRLPDYPGNGMYQSLGNLAVDARMGMLFPAFDNGDLLHLTGTGRVIWDVPDVEAKTGGTGRFLEFRVERWVRTPAMPAAPARTFVEGSPYNP